MNLDKYIRMALTNISKKYKITIIEITFAKEEKISKNYTVSYEELNSEKKLLELQDRLKKTQDKVKKIDEEDKKEKKQIEARKESLNKLEKTVDELNGTLGIKK